MQRRIQVFPSGDAAPFVLINFPSIVRSKRYLYKVDIQLLRSAAAKSSYKTDGVGPSATLIG